MSAIAEVDCGYLAVVQAMADDIWVNRIQAADQKTYAEAARAVLEQQEVNFNFVQNGKKRAVVVEWHDLCDATTSACTTDCDNNGADLTPICKTYDLDICREYAFKVPFKAYRERTFDQQMAVAKNFVDGFKKLDEYIAQQIVTGLVANAGTNVFTGGIGDVDTTATYVLAPYWDAQMFGYLAQVAANNKFENPYVITGNNLFVPLFNLRAAGGSPIFPVYQDVFNVETVEAGSTFLLHKSAVGFFAENYYPLNAGNAIKKGDYLLWSQNSPSLPGVTYDIVYFSSCESNDWYDNYKIILNGAFVVNPTGCDETNTGILEFLCGAKPQN